MATARALFFADGYHPTSLDKVADAAGFSKGAVYSNFRNKDELCAAVLDEIRTERFGEVLDMLAEPHIDTRLERLRQWAQRVVGDPGWTSLEIEFAVHALRSEPLRGQSATGLNNLIGLLAPAIGTDDDAAQLPPSELATIVLALGVGLGLFRAIDPSIPVEGLVDTVRILAGGKDAREGGPKLS